MTIILSNLNRVQNFLTGRFLGRFAVKCILKIPSHLAYVATLPCETIMSAEQAINDKLQGSVAIYLRCGEVFNNKLRKVYCRVCVQFFKSVNIWQSYKQERDCLMHFLRLLASVFTRRAKCVKQPCYTTKSRAYSTIKYKLFITKPS